MYFLNAKATEQITQFALEGWWLTDFFSFMDKQPSDYYIQTIEASKVISIEYGIERVQFICTLFFIISHLKLINSQNW